MSARTICKCSGHCPCPVTCGACTEECHERKFDAEMAEGAAVAEALPRWVPVGERLPPVDSEVLVTGDSGAVCMAHMCPTYDDEIAPHEWRSGDWTVHNVTAWQPLPAPWVAP